MSNYIFPSLPGISIERTRSPVWSSTVQETISGRTMGLTCQTYPRWKYKLSFEVLRSGALQELEAIVGLFNKVRGRTDTFLFQDEDDAAINGQQIGVGDGVTSTFQLVRSFGDFIEPISDVNTITAVTVGGTPVSTYSYVGAGRISFLTPPASGLAVAWSGSFYRRCRFDTDELSADRFLWQLWRARSVEFTTVKA